MIRYALVCQKGHDFESWFPNSEAYEKQAKRGLVACPRCGSTKVEKALMSPQVKRGDKESPISPIPVPVAGAAEASGAAEAAAAPVALLSPQEREFRTKLKELRDHLTRNSHYVGKRFAEEARKMHYGEIEHRSIYGEATPEDARALHEEGIEFHPLPILPDERN